jgi:ABC-type uncharacterized transport system auxiliary subunit
MRKRESKRGHRASAPLRVAALLAAAVLAGCGGLRSDAEPDRIYVLNVATATPAATPLPGVLVIPRPAVQPGLDSDRIALLRSGNELDFYAASRWGAPVPQVLGAFAMQSLTGTFVTVTTQERSAGLASFELLLTARHFEAVYSGSGAPEVRVALDCLLVATAPRKVLGPCNADVREQAADNRMAPVVQAFEQATQRAFEEVRRQVATLARQ